MTRINTDLDPSILLDQPTFDLLYKPYKEHND